ncbi:hypothetical protein BH24DEI2_BH24DEI2_14560 [soil metagenome]
MSAVAIRTLPAPQSYIIGFFLFLVAAALAVSPLPLLYRSAGILFIMYLTFSVAGMGFVYLTALLAPPVGLLSGNADRLVMLPPVLASTLLGALGLEYAWRYPALVVSPLLAVLPPFIAYTLSRQTLFAVALPWEPAPTWLGLHALVALAGVLVAVYLDRRRAQRPDG